MKPLLHAIRHPLVPVLLAAAALGLLLWFAGPLVAIAGHVPLASTAARSIAIGLLLPALLLHRIAPRLRAASAGFLHRPHPGQQAKTESDQLQRLRQRLRQAVEVLRRSELGRRQRGWA